MSASARRFSASGRTPRDAFRVMARPREGMIQISNSAQLRDLAARCARVLRSHRPPKSRGRRRPLRAQATPRKGRRESRVPEAPAARVQLVVSTRSSPQARRNTRPSLRDGFNGFLRALPGDEFLAVTVVSGSRLVETRSGRLRLRSLDTSNGCQDHTTSPSAATLACPSTGHVRPAEIPAKVLKRRSSCAREPAHGKPPCEHICAPDAAASIASNPASVTIAIRPLVEWMA
jgi:hypothetical protein